MTDYTQAGAELAAKLANEVAIVPHTFRAHQFQNDLVYPERAAFGNFCAQVLKERDALADLQASYDAAVKDLREIDRIALENEWANPMYASDLLEAAAIAAKYRVETDPLTEALREAYGAAAPEFVEATRAALAKRGVTV